jgi:PHD/YefM family antitoxin component YafN of YafNO toxin-antitoxin module
MHLREDSQSISYVKANTDKVLDQVSVSGPMVITRNGKAPPCLWA